MTGIITGPQNLEQLIGIIQTDFPNAGIRITGRSRTIRRQAELMAERIRTDRDEFVQTYASRQHIVEMDTWFQNNTDSTLDETGTEFEGIIRRARQRGATVSNHLSDTARDISWPNGTSQQLDSIEARISGLGASVIREPNAAGGRHWHVDW